MKNIDPKFTPKATKEELFTRRFRDEILNYNIAPIIINELPSRNSNALVNEFFPGRDTYIRAATFKSTDVYVPLSDIINMSTQELLKIHNFGKKGLRELDNLLFMYFNINLKPAFKGNNAYGYAFQTRKELLLYALNKAIQVEKNFVKSEESDNFKLSHENIIKDMEEEIRLILNKNYR